MSYTSRNDRGIEQWNVAVFFVFSFLYLFLYQTDIERMAHPEFTGDVIIVFHPLLLSLIFASVVTGLRALWVRILGFHGMWDGLNYLPSALLLGANTAFNSEHIMGHSWGAWIALIAVSVAVLIGMRLFSSVYRRNREDRIKGWTVNMAVLTVVLLLPCLVSNSNEVTHRELAAARYLEKGRYERVLAIGSGAEEVSSLLTLSRTRAMAMADAGSSPEGSQLGEMMFLYPLPYPRMVSNALQDTAYHSARRENALLTAMLLNKDLAGFVSSLEAPSDTSLISAVSWQDGSFPLFYLQAVLLNDSIAGQQTGFLDEAYPQQTTEQRALFGAYNKEKAALEGQPLQYRSNSLRKRYGKTYWWFYDFQN